MKEDVQPKKRSEKIIISISGETSEWLELYCKTDGILRKDFVSLPLDYFEHTAGLTCNIAFLIISHWRRLSENCAGYIMNKRLSEKYM